MEIEMIWKKRNQIENATFNLKSDNLDFYVNRKVRRRRP